MYSNSESKTPQPNNLVSIWYIIKLGVSDTDILADVKKNYTVRQRCGCYSLQVKLHMYHKIT